MTIPNPTHPAASTIDADRVRALFAQPQRVAASAFMRREVSNRMQERLDLLKLTPQSLLDAGCSEGGDVIALQRRYRQARITGVDASPAMLAAARAGYQASVPLLRRGLDTLMQRAPQWRCEDLAAVSSPDASVDLLWSNLALHWHPQPQAVFAEWRRVLRIGGALTFSCFGPDTFREVRQAFAAADAYPHALAFIDMHDLGDMLIVAGFPAPVMDMETITVTYDAPQDLLADVRAFGGNPLTQQRRGLMSRAQGACVMQALEATRGADGRIPLTFEIVYGHAFRDDIANPAQGEAVVRFMPRG